MSVSTLTSGWRFRLKAGLQLFLSAVFAAGGNACTVPVFRYALDRWPAEAWTLDAPRDAFLTEPLATSLRNLGGNSPLNLTARPRTDAASAEARLSFPGTAKDTVAWTGPLTAEAFRVLTDSPARQAIARRILSGDSLVWVVVTGPDAVASEALTARLQKRLAFVQNAARLPQLDPNDPSSRLGPGPELKLILSHLSVRHDDPAESVLLAMLAGPDGGELLKSAASFAAAVFGRGRVLGAWAANELSDERIDQTSLFVVRACSCEVKSLHPGWDLLMNLDWDAELRQVQDSRGAPSAASLTGVAPPAPEVVTFTPQVPAAPAAQKPRADLWWIAAAGFTAMALLAVFLFIRGKR